MSSVRRRLRISVIIITSIVSGLSFPLLPSLADSTVTLTRGTTSDYSLISGGTIVVGATTQYSGTAPVALAIAPGNIDSAIASAFDTAGLHIFENNSSRAETATADLLVLKTQLETLTATGIAAEIGGETYTAGIYAVPVGTAMGFTGSITLDGGGNYQSVFVFRTTAAFTSAASSNVNLINGAQAANIYWVSGAATTTGANSIIFGNIVAGAAITTGESSTVYGSVLGLSDISLGASSQIIHNLAESAPTPPPPAPEPEPAPPAPAPVYIPEPVYVAPIPLPVLVPTPTPTPTPTPSPTPTPLPSPVVELVIEPTPEPSPAPSPSSQVLAPLPTPSKKPRPLPEVITYESVAIQGNGNSVQISLHNLIPGQAITITVRAVK